MDSRGKKVRGIAWVLFAVLLIGLCATPYTYASEQDVRNQLDQVNQDKKDLQNELNQTKKESSALASEIKILDKKIYAAESELNQLQHSINDTKDEIEATLARLDRKQAEIDRQNEDLNARLRAMYKSGDAGMLSVLLGSMSFSEFMTNADMVERIYESDAEVLEQLKSQHAEIQEINDELLALKEKLLAQQADEKARQAQLEEDKATAAAKKKSVDADVKELEAQVDALNEEAKKLSAEILRLQSSGNYIGGDMIWPSEASTKVTSPFGNRLHPILKVYKLHTGIDIGAGGGTNILAANAGTVISAGWNSGYGYMVMIDHGGGIVTLYAHSSKLLVKKGDKVTRGQVIAKVGSTGMSTGNHLHFEVRINGQYKNPLDYVSASVRK